MTHSLRIAPLAFLLVGIVVTRPSVLSAETPSPVEVAVRPNQVKWQISPYLLGMHFVYPHEKDSLYADGRIARWAKSVKVGVARFPGGSVDKYWNWANPTGVFSGDRNDPEYDPNSDVPGSQWMSLDEYLEFCRQSGAEPMVGVNIWSGHVYDRTDEGIDEAIACIRYCKRQGHDVKWWYLGNEEHLSIKQLADLYNRYVPAMKAVDPEIKVIANRNKINSTSLTELLDLAGRHIDMIEFHGKWKGFRVAGTFAMWEKEHPLVIGDRGYAYSRQIVELRRAAADAGYPELLFANNEWGLGQKFEGFDKFRYSLVMTEYLQDLFLGNFHMACLWSTHWPKRADKHLLDATDGYAFNPIALGFELLSTSQGESMVESSTNEPLVYGFACRNREGSRLQIYLLNKFGTPREAVVSVDSFRADADQMPSGTVLKTPGRALADLEVTQEATTGRFHVTLPPHSYTRLTLRGTIDQ